MSYLLLDYNVEDPNHSQRMAEMFNDFDSVWPDGFTRGIPETAQNVETRMRREQRLAVCVVQYEDQFVGYCDLKSQFGVTDVAYIPTLGACGAHHGKGVGKRLLREMVRRVSELGYREVHLDTWSGNMKAVPLYKKIGFHWIPNTDVDMRNFMPGLLASPIGKAFFANRDWYECHQRTLEVAPDDVTWQGMKVYPYSFRDGDDFLNVTFDAASGGMTAVETPRYSLSCHIPFEEAACGGTYAVTWSIIPPEGETLEVALFAEGEAGLDIQAQERFVVNSPTTFTRNLHIPSDTLPLPQDAPSRKIRSTFIINGEPVALETGVKVVRPLEIEFGGQGLFVGRRERVTVVLKNSLETELTGHLVLDAHPYLACDTPNQPFTLPPRSKTECVFQITATQTGLHSLPLRYVAGDWQGQRTLFFPTQETLRGYEDTYSETALLQNAAMRLRVFVRGGFVECQPAGASKETVGAYFPELGPPFAGWSLRQTRYPFRFEETPQGLAMITTTPSGDHPGVSTESRYTFISDNVVRIQTHILNRSDVAHALQLRLGFDGRVGGNLISPTPRGILREPLLGFGEYPESEDDVLAHGERMAESWVAQDNAGQYCGVVWEGDYMPQYSWRSFPALIHEMREIAPRSVCSAPDCYLLTGAGDWEVVRAFWKRIAQVEESEAPKPKPTLDVVAERKTLVLTEDSERVRLNATYLRSKKIEGELRVRGERFRPEVAAFPFTDLNRDNPFSVEALFNAPTELDAEVLIAELNIGCTTKEYRIPAIRLAKPGETKVSVEATGEIIVDNGFLSYRVAPAFLGSVYALETNGVNHLFSAYPEVSQFQWTRPWYGGIHPTIAQLGQLGMNKEVFEGDSVVRTGAQGLEWRGAKVRCVCQHKDWRWLTMETEYLTLPHSNVLAIVSRWTNRSSAKQSFEGGAGMWLQVGGDRSKALSFTQRGDTPYNRRRGGFAVELSAMDWSAVQNTETQETLLLAPSKAGSVVFEDFNADGTHTGFLNSITLEPNQTREFVSWVALLPNSSNLSATRQALGQMEALP